MNFIRDFALWFMHLLDGSSHWVQSFALCFGLFLFAFIMFAVAGVMAKISMWLWPSLRPYMEQDDEYL